MDAPKKSLWSYPAFRLLWGSDTLSLFGLHTTLLALPLTAIQLGATPLQLGVLTSAQTAPALLLGLFAGVWIDRRRRRPLLIGANAARAALLISIPLIAYPGILSLNYLYVVAFLSGIAAFVFVVAYQAFLPTVVSRKQLVAGNSALRGSEAAAQFAGPSIGGVLVQLTSAPLTIGIGALTSLGSAFAILMIRTPESPPRRAQDDTSIGSAIGTGIRFIITHPLLRPLLGGSTAGAICSSMIAGVYILYVVRDLDIPSAALGLIVGAGGPPALLAAVFATGVIRRYGLGVTLIATSIVRGGAALLLPLAGGPLQIAIILLLLWRMLTSIAEAMASIASFTLVQSAPPPWLQGRVNATVRVCGWGASTIGGLLGGGLGQLIGLRPTLTLAAIGTILSGLWLIHARIDRISSAEQYAE